LESQTYKVIAHSRYSTNVSGIDAVHPFTDKAQKNALVHNGIVDVPDNVYLESGNDSEYLTNSYFSKGSKALKNISGYFAFLALNHSGTIDVIRDDTAKLFASYLPDFETYIFATTEKIIEKIQKILKDNSDICEFPKNTGLIFDGIKLESRFTFKKKAKPILKASEIESYSAKLEKSLGVKQAETYSEAMSSYIDDAPSYKAHKSYKSESLSNKHAD
jgi:asparagine synthetase B (glutamine-hydrolysing)